MDDHRFLKAINRGNIEDPTSFFEQIYNKYYRLLFFVAFNYLKDEVLAQDVVQGVFVSFFERCLNGDFLENIRNLKTYLCITTKNASLKELKSQSLKSYDFDIDEVADKGESTHKEYLLYDILNKLSKEEINLLIDHLCFDKSFGAISKETNVSPNTLKSKYRRAIKKIRLEISK